MLKLYLYVYLCSVICIVSCQKVETSLKNLTETDKATPVKRGDDPIKKDIRKYLRECGADVSDEDEKSEEAEHQPEPQNAHWAYENKNNDNNNNKNKNKKDDKKNRGSYPTSYGDNKRGSYPTSYGNKNKNGDDCDDNNEDDDDDDRNKNPRNKNKGKKKMYRSSQLVETFKTTHSNFENYRDRNNKRRNKKPQNSEDYDESEEDGNCNDNNNNNRNKYGNRNNNKNNNRDRNQGGGNNRRGNNNRGGMGYGGSRYGNEGNRYGGDPYGNRYGNNEDFGMYDAWGGNRGYNIYGGRLMHVYNITEEPAAPRSKRETDNENLQCLSQCVFGYMEMLDDNRVPSETEVIKYLQSNIQDGSKRIKTVREARRCFARLSTTDNEDGCKFSKALSKCMNLEIDGKS